MSDPAGASGASISELAAAVVAKARESGNQIAVAESLTGGMLAAALVSVPGASRVFMGGIVAYNTALKRSLLHVDEELLRERGPVDERVARQMARSVRNVCAVPKLGAANGQSIELGLATTGVAGPAPDPQTGLPPGTVWIAASTPTEERVQRLENLAHLSREQIRSHTVAAALSLALNMLERD